MKHIKILIVDDDFNKISSVIKTIKEVFDGALSITQAQSVQEALENIQKTEYHLLITDFQMPLRNGDEAVANGGIVLIKSLYKKKTKAIMPLYIVGLTQYQELKELYNGVWKVWHYDSSAIEWKNNIRDLIHHISLVKSRVVEEKTESLFVEGISDQKILEKGMEFYYPVYTMTIKIEAIKYGGGSSWVERQLFIWAKSLVKKNGTDVYLQAVGIFDDDSAGNNAIENIRKQITVDSAESNTFGIVRASQKYSIILKEIKAKGLTFPTTIEDLFPAELFKKAKNNNWVVRRNLDHYKIDNELLSLDKDEISKQALLANGFTEDQILLILYKIDDAYKMDFNALVLGESKESFQYIGFLIKDILEKLKLFKS